MDAARLKFDNKEREGCELTGSDQESIATMLKEYYQEKSELYYLCTCVCCEKLTLPFLIKKDIEIGEVETLQKKHLEYYKRQLPDDLSLSTSMPDIHIDNILFKKINLGEVKFKWSLT